MMDQATLWLRGGPGGRVGRNGVGYAADPAAPAVQVGELGAWQAWGAGSDSTEKLGGEASTGGGGLSGRTAGAAAGLEHQVNPDLLVGFAAGGGHASFSVPDRTTSGNLDAVDAGRLCGRPTRRVLCGRRARHHRLRHLESSTANSRPALNSIPPAPARRGPGNVRNAMLR